MSGICLLCNKLFGWYPLSFEIVSRKPTPAKPRIDETKSTFEMYPEKTENLFFNRS